MGVINDAGKLVLGSCQGAGYTLTLLYRTAKALPHLPFKVRFTLDQMFAAGIKTIPVTLIVAVFAGMILSLQTGLELQKYGQHTLIGNIVAISMCREMGPFITALILAATVGSAMAAELGTMNVSEEIMALEVMSIDPVRFLVLPRVVALTLMCPILTILTDIVGIAGGGIVATTQLGISFPYYLNSARESLTSMGQGLPKDVYVGIFKAWIFGVTISIIGCSCGLRARGGAIGVGNAVRQAVKTAFLLIIVLGYIVTWFFYRLLGS